MAPNKRVGSTKPEPSPKKLKGGGDELAEQAAHACQFLASTEYFEAAMQELDSILTTYGSLPKWLDELYPDADARAELALHLDQLLPEENNVLYMKDGDWTVGPKCARLYMFGWHVNMGNKGLMVDDYMKNLVSLIMAQGFRTDPCLPGTEALVVCAPDERLFDDQNLLAINTVKDGLMKSHSVAFVKGWARTVCALSTVLIFDKLGIWDKLPKAVKASFSTAHCVVARFDNATAMVDAARGRTHQYHNFVSCM